MWHARAAQGFPISVTFETPKKGTMLKCSTGRRMARTRQPAPIATPRMDLSRLQYFPLALPHFSLLAGIFLCTLSLSDTHRLRGRPVLRVRIGRPLRLLRGIRQMLVEPQGVSTKIKLARPFEAAPALANTDLREERRIVEGGKDALADQ